MIIYEVHFKLISKDSNNEDIDNNRVIFFKPYEYVLVDGDVLEWVFVKDLALYDSVVEWTILNGRTTWKVEEIKKFHSKVEGVKW